MTKEGDLIKSFPEGEGSTLIYAGPLVAGLLGRGDPDAGGPFWRKRKKKRGNQKKQQRRREKGKRGKEPSLY